MQCNLSLAKITKTSTPSDAFFVTVSLRRVLNKMLDLFFQVQSWSAFTLQSIIPSCMDNGHANSLSDLLNLKVHNYQMLCYRHVRTYL